MARLTQPLTSRLAAASIRAFCRQAVRRIDLHVEGFDNVPTTRPAILAARHYHHFYDGCALIALVPRPLHLLVTLDWLENPAGLRLMRSACQMAHWPVVARVDASLEQPAHPPGATTANGTTPVNPAQEESRLLGAVVGPDNTLTRADAAEHRRPIPLAATRQCVDLLRAGELLLVFPEGYPTIDPVFTPKSSDEDVLPFQPGFLRFAALAERDGLTRVPIIPVGLEYARGVPWLLTVRFGRPVSVSPDADFAAHAAAIEQQVKILSGLRLPGCAPAQRQTDTNGIEVTGSDVLTLANQISISPTQGT